MINRMLVSLIACVAASSVCQLASADPSRHAVASAVAGRSEHGPVRSNPALLATRLAGNVTFQVAPMLGMNEAVVHPEYANLLCATFVSAMLRNTGYLPPTATWLTHPKSLEAALRALGWKQVSVDHARTGAVVFYDQPPTDHTELFLGKRGPVVTTVGSNNVWGMAAPQAITIEHRDWRSLAAMTRVYQLP